MKGGNITVLDSVKDGTEVKVCQVRSCIGRSAHFRRILDTLGLGRIGNSTKLKVNPATRASLSRVQHVIELHK